MKITNETYFNELNKISEKVIGCAIKVHKEIGPGLLEKVYETCLVHELRKKGLKCDTQVVVPIIYDSIKFEEGFRIDILVEEKVIVELKAQENFNPVWTSQTLSYLRMTNNHLGLIINFNMPYFKDGIRRVVL